MKKLELNVELREKWEDLKKLRSSRVIPAVVYGHKQEPISLKMDNSDFLRTFRASWESHIINLKIWKKTIEVLVHDIQREPISWEFQHIDFYAITKGEKLTTKIHLNFIWDSEAAKLWAIIEEHLKEIEVKCLPADLVDAFDVDISLLKEFWNSIRVSDLLIDSKFEIQSPMREVVITASKPAKVEDLDAPIDNVLVTWAETEEEKEAKDSK